MAVVNITFRSEQLKRNTQVCLCLPDSIRMNNRAISDRKVLWLLHGLSEDNTSWLSYSNIAYYAMKGDFIVIMPAGDRSMYCDNINGQNYFKFIADELPGYFHQIFGISNEREKNYIAGLSMGGLGAAKIALTYPERYESPVGELSLSALGKLTFFEPDYDTFRCINLCREAINKGGLFPAAVNSANEQANAMFRSGEIGFLEIADRVERVLETAPQKTDYTLGDILEVDRWAREAVLSV